jgi:hypothetical protein
MDFSEDRGGEDIVSCARVSTPVPVVRRRGSRGNSLIEFTLVGIPLFFVLLSTFEMARGMWVYHTLAYTAKEGTRFVITKGNDCAVNPNSCAVKLQDVAKKIQYAGLGLDPTQLQVRFVSLTRTIGYETLQTALNDTTTYWPANAPGSASADIGADPGQDLEIDIKYPFRSAIAFFWPGAGPGFTFGTFTLPASSKEQIQF